MKFGYSDSPYYGCCAYYKHNHGTGSRPFDGKCWNDIETHVLHVQWLADNYPDGFAWCTSSTALLDVVEAGAFKGLNRRHPGSWSKPFASFKPGINPGYCWEPVVFVGGRPLGRDVDTVRDFLSESITLKKGLAGAKPFRFCLWVLEMLGFQPGIDELDDIFPGTGIMSKAVAYRCGVPAEQLRLVP